MNSSWKTQFVSVLGAFAAMICLTVAATTPLAMTIQIASDRVCMVPSDCERKIGMKSAITSSGANNKGFVAGQVLPFRASKRRYRSTPCASPTAS